MLISREKTLRDFCGKFALNFADFSLLERALTHSSKTYERLEFLGDAVLKIVISEFLFKEFPEADEGELTQYRAYIVSDAVLSNLADEIGLGELVLLGSGVKMQSSIKACALEALLGAVFLDAGLNAANDFLLKNFSLKFAELIEESEFSNPKAILQEYTQGKNNDLPVYKTVNETGDAHDKTFEVEVIYRGLVIGAGKGKSKKEAQQKAAKEALINLGVV